MFAHRWDDVSRLLGVERDGALPAANAAATFARFRAMVVAVFSASSVISGLPDERRRMLGAAIHACPNEEALVEVSHSPSKLNSMLICTLIVNALTQTQLTLHAIQTSQVLSEDARMRIATAVLDQRYDQLLLPSHLGISCFEPYRFPVSAMIIVLCCLQCDVLIVFSESDCEEALRRHTPKEATPAAAAAAAAAAFLPEPEPVECPVCLGVQDVDTVLPCHGTHILCSDCVRDWYDVCDCSPVYVV